VTINNFGSNSARIALARIALRSNGDTYRTWPPKGRRVEATEWVRRSLGGIGDGLAEPHGVRGAPDGDRLIGVLLDDDGSVRRHRQAILGLNLVFEAVRDGWQRARWLERKLNA
jgi:hypothetical protein